MCKVDPPSASLSATPDAEASSAVVGMSKIEEIFVHAAMHLLEKSTLISEWVHHAEVKLVPKPRGGRPEGGIAARQLPMPPRFDLEHAESHALYEARQHFLSR
jgi:hypothetical protein